MAPPQGKEKSTCAYRYLTSVPRTYDCEEGDRISSWTSVTEEGFWEVDTDRELSIKVENVVRSATTVHLELVRDEQEDPDRQDAP